MHVSKRNMFKYVLSSIRQSKHALNVQSWSHTSKPHHYNDQIIVPDPDFASFNDFSCMILWSFEFEGFIFKLKTLCGFMYSWIALTIFAVWHKLWWGPQFKHPRGCVNRIEILILWGSGVVCEGLVSSVRVWYFSATTTCLPLDLYQIFSWPDDGDNVTVPSTQWDLIYQHKWKTGQYYSY